MPMSYSYLVCNEQIYILTRRMFVFIFRLIYLNRLVTTVISLLHVPYTLLDFLSFILCNLSMTLL